MVDGTTLTAIPLPRETADPTQRGVAAAVDRASQVQEKIRADGERGPPPVSSDGHAGPGGEKGGLLNVLA